jgi:hypothetical protein
MSGATSSVAWNIKFLIAQVNSIFSVLANSICSHTADQNVTNFPSGEYHTWYADTADREQRQNEKHFY